MESKQPPARLRLWTRLAYVLLLIVAIFAAWQAHELWMSGRLGEPPPADRAPGLAASRPIRSARTRPAPLVPALPLPAQAASQSQPASILDEDVFPGGGIEPLPEDPVGVEPPEGATGLKAYALPNDGVMAHYLWRGTVPAAAGYYEETLRAQGCQLLDRAAEGGRQSLTFRGQGRRVIVALQANARDARIVDIEVTVIRLPK